jgi:hypothetical protein
VTLNAIAYILSLLGERQSIVEAVHVTDDRDEGQRLQRHWQDLGLAVPLVVLESPNRAPAATLSQYIAFLLRESGLRTVVTVAIPETVPTRWWHPLFRNYFASRFKLALMPRPGVTVSSLSP